MKSIVPTLALLMILALPTAALFAGEAISEVEVTLPDHLNWVLLTETHQGGQYLREWVPEGSNGESTIWLIVEQKFQLDRKVSGKKYLNTIFSLAEQACSHVLVNGPTKIMLESRKTFVGRFMCGQQIGRDYGTFTDLRVIVDRKNLYVITSELRVPPSPVAGTLAFPGDQKEALAEFMANQEISAGVVRDSVRLCFGECSQSR